MRKEMETSVRRRWPVCAASVLAVAGAAFASVSNVTMSEDPVTRLVTVTYSLDEPAIVTATFSTNGVALPLGAGIAGDVNRYVAKTSGSFTWYPEKSAEGAWDALSETRVQVKAWATNAPPDYLVVDLVAPKAVWFYERAEDLPGGISSDLYRTQRLAMRRIPAANVVWCMGSRPGETEREVSGLKETAHNVVLTHDYYLGVYKVTQQQCAFFGGGYSALVVKYFSRWSFLTKDETCPDHLLTPMSCIPYKDLRGGDGEVTAGSLIGALRSLTGIGTFDLPTEAEWEYACRAGTVTRSYDGTDTTTTLTQLAWYKDNSKGTFHPVGKLLPNAWGLFDMYGLTNEYTRDWTDARADYVITANPMVDPTGPASGSSKVVRGGTIDHDAKRDRSASRDLGNYEGDASYYFGFRLRCAAAFNFN